MTRIEISPAAAAASAIWAEIDRRFAYNTRLATDGQLEASLIELASGEPGEAVMAIMLLEDIGPDQSDGRRPWRHPQAPRNVNDALARTAP